MQVKKLKQRDEIFDKAMGVLDKKSLTDNVNTLTDVSQTNRILKAVNAARAVDFFTHLRRLWGDWDKIRKRILAIMGKYIESEDEKRINYLKRKLIQWKDNAKKMNDFLSNTPIALSNISSLCLSFFTCMNHFLTKNLLARNLFLSSQFSNNCLIKIRIFLNSTPSLS